MPSYTELPIVLINHYLWDLAKGNVSGQPAVASAVWNTNTYPFMPFYPVTESLAPESATLPYVLYDYMFVPGSGTFWPLQKEDADYIIVGDLPQIFYVKNWIVESLERWDESARNINDHLASQGYLTKFKYINVFQENFIMDERRIDSFKPKFITCLKVCYEYTK
jgi:hypothetical protein